MAFPSKYNVEFYQPCHDPAAKSRVLVCARMYSRNYIPLASSSGLRFAVPNTKSEDVMLALLMPPSRMRCLSWKDERIDFGETMLNVLRVMDEAEYGCAIGVYDCSLEMELVSALEATEG